jgi:hypothetical protein
MSIYLGLAVILLILWQIIKIGWLGWMDVQTARRVKQRRSTDISQHQLTPPSRTHEIVTSLTALGFHRLGEAVSELPYKRYATVWVMVNQENTVQAEVVFGWMSLSSYFQEDVLVVTDYPTGEHIEMPGYQCHHIGSNIYEAYLHQLEQVDEFRHSYGVPNPIKTMADYFKWEIVGRIKYGPIKLKNLYHLNIVRVLTFGYAAAVCILVPLLHGIKFPFNSAEAANSLAQVELWIIGLIYPAPFFPTVFSRWQDRQMVKKVNRENKEPG